MFLLIKHDNFVMLSENKVFEYITLSLSMQIQRDEEEEEKHNKKKKVIISILGVVKLWIFIFFTDYRFSVRYKI